MVTDSKREQNYETTSVTTISRTWPLDSLAGTKPVRPGGGNAQARIPNSDGNTWLFSASVSAPCCDDGHYALDYRVALTTLKQPHTLGHNAPCIPQKAVKMATHQKERT
jgi:hypothetical protein